MSASASKVLLLDDFTNSQIDLATHLGNGSIAEPAGTLLNFDAPNSVDCDWFGSTRNAPMAYVHIGGKKLYRCETRLAAFAHTTNLCLAGINIFTKELLASTSYDLVWYPNENRLIIDLNSNFRLWNGPSNDPAVTPHRYRVYVNTTDSLAYVEGTTEVPKNTISFWYSVDDGATYVHAVNRTLDFTPEVAGMFLRKWATGSGDNAQASFDYFEVRQYTNDITKPETTGLKDQVIFPDIVGPKSYSQGFGVGQLIPGPPAQQAGSIGPFDGTSLEDVVEIGATPVLLGTPLIERHAAEIDDAVVLGLGASADYADFIDDGDGNATLGGDSVGAVISVDTTVGDFGNPVANNHWGAAADGKFYANGVECGPGVFGTLANGHNHEAWRNTQEEPYKVSPGDDTGTANITADDVLSLAGTFSGWNGGPGVHSDGKWVLTGDFDIQVDFANYSATVGMSELALFAIFNYNGSEGSNMVYMVRNLQFGGQYSFNRHENGAWANLGATSTTDTAGKLRLTRVGSLIRGYFWNGSGWTEVGSGYSHTHGADDIMIRIGINSDAGSMSADVSAFIINSGTTSNRAGWYREASGAHRGTLQAMPNNMGIVSTVDSIDLLDLDTNKLWMRFDKGVGNANIQSLTSRPRRVAWDDGLLLVGQGSGESETQEGAGTMIDFTQDTVKMYREAASLPGAWYGGTYDRAKGHIATRNDALSYSGSDAAWVIPDYRVFGVSIYRDSGFEFHAMGTVDGVGVGKRQRRYISTSPYAWTSSSTELTTMFAVLLDPSDGELFYMDSATLHSIDKTTWEGVMLTTQVFTAAVTKTLPGTRSSDLQKHFVRVGTKIYVPANEGIYLVDWPAGSFVLQYGGPGSGAVFPILPDLLPVNAIAYALDGATNTLVCALSGDVPLAVINLDTNAIHGIAPAALGKTPTVVAVY